MRKSAHVALLFFLGILSTAALGVVTAITAAVSLAATALIVPGTGTPDATNVDNYMSHARDRYIAPFSSTCNDASCGTLSAKYPASFFPLVIFPGWCEPGRCNTWNDSVGQGVQSLDGLIRNTNDNNLTVFGYSQGGAVVSNELRNIAANDPSLFSKIDNVVTIGNIYNPDGGLFTRLGFLPTIPGLDITFGPKTPVDIPELAGKFTSIGFEYDPVMYAPLYWGNPLAMLNALAAFETVHGYYLTPDGNGPDDPIAYGYTADEIHTILSVPCDQSPNCRRDTNAPVGGEGNEYWMIPAKSLPIFDLVMQEVPAALKPLLQPIVNLLTPVTKVLIDLGYDWSGDPGTQKYLSPLPFNPFQNWLKVGTDIVAAIGQGVQDAFGGGTTMIAPATPAPNVLAFNARSSGTQQSTLQVAQGTSSQPQATTPQPQGNTPELPQGTTEQGATGQQTGQLNENDAKLSEALKDDEKSGTTTTGTTGITTTGTTTTGTTGTTTTSTATTTGTTGTTTGTTGTTGTTTTSTGTTTGTTTTGTTTSGTTTTGTGTTSAGTTGTGSTGTGSTGESHAAAA